MNPIPPEFTEKDIEAMEAIQKVVGVSQRIAECALAALTGFFGKITPPPTFRRVYLYRRKAKKKKGK